MWNLIRSHLEHISFSWERKERVSFMLKDIADGEPCTVSVKQMFGKWYVRFRDTNNQTINLGPDEWKHFTAYMSCLTKYITQLWADENEIMKEIQRNLSGQTFILPMYFPANCWWLDRLEDEVNAYKIVVGDATPSDEY